MEKKGKKGEEGLRVILRTRLLLLPRNTGGLTFRQKGDRGSGLRWFSCKKVGVPSGLGSEVLGRESGKKTTRRYRGVEREWPRAVRKGRLEKEGNKIFYPERKKAQTCYLYVGVHTKEPKHLSGKKRGAKGK